MLEVWEDFEGMFERIFWSWEKPFQDVKRSSKIKVWRARNRPEIDQEKIKKATFEEGRHLEGAWSHVLFFSGLLGSLLGSMLVYCLEFLGWQMLNGFW